MAPRGRAVKSAWPDIHSRFAGALPAGPFVWEFNGLLAIRRTGFS
jgi:hypothetical protein